jgi:Zn/Cd-binding protein ZinT
MLLKMIKDESDWVKISAFKHMPKCLIKIKDKEVKRKMVDKFLKFPDHIVSPYKEEVFKDFAHNFPALLFAMGCDFWD